MRTVLLVGMLVFAGLSMPGAACADTLDELKALKPYLPGDSRGILFLRSPSSVKGLFDGSPLVDAERVERHVKEALKGFADSTQFHIMKDTDWAVLNVTWPEGADIQNPLIFVHGHFQPSRLLPIIEQDPLMTTGQVTRDEIGGRPLYTTDSGTAAAFPTDNLLVLGEEELVRESMAGDRKPKDSFDVSAALKGFDPLSHRLFVSLELEGLAGLIAAKTRNPAVASIASKIVRISGHLTSDTASLGLEFHTAGDAKASSDMLAGMKEFAKSYLVLLATKHQSTHPDSVLAGIRPEAIYSRIVAEAAGEFLTALMIESRSKLMVLTAPRHRLPFLSGGDGPISLLAASAVIAVPNVLRGKAMAAQQVCFVNQRIIKTAVERFRAKHSPKKMPELNAIGDTLVEEGMLATRPDCPTQGRGSFRKYKLVKGYRLSCPVHGEAPPASTPSLGLIPQAPPMPQLPAADAEDDEGEEDAPETEADESGGEGAEEPGSPEAADGDQE